MNQKTITVQTSTIVEEISNLEKQISDVISPQFLDYVFILSPHRQDQIVLSRPLTLKQSNIIDRYNKIVIDYFESINLPIDVEGKNQFETYMETSRNVYLTRFIEARMLFAEYALFSIPTKEAIDLSNKFSPDLEPAVSMEIKISDSMYLFDDGNLDFKKTVRKEESSNMTKATLSSYDNLSYLTYKSVRDLYNITTRAFLVNLNQDALVNLMEVVIQKIIIESNRLVYSYIDKGYPAINAIENVKSLLEKSTKKEGTELPGLFKEIKKDVEDTIDFNLEENIKLEKKYRDELRNEILELLVHYSSIGKYVSSNFYQLKFLEFEQLPDAYKRYHHVVESYLYDDYGNLSSFPVEAYDIDFSRDFKRTLFELVTNGNINPNLTLEDYLFSV